MGTIYQPVQTNDDTELVDRAADTDRDIELGESVPPAYSNKPDEVAQTDDEPSPFSNAELKKRAPSVQGTNADVRAFIQLLLEKRGETYDILPGHNSPASGRDVHYLTGADLHYLNEEKLANMLPEDWPGVLRTLVAKDVKWIREDVGSRDVSRFTVRD
jgi:hypothetical protein